MGELAEWVPRGEYVQTIGREGCTSKKNLEGLYEVLAPSLNILKVSPTTSTKKEPGKPIVTVRNSDIAKFGTLQERQNPLKVYANRRGPRIGEKLVQEHIQSHIKQFTRKIKGDKKTKHRRREPGSGVIFKIQHLTRDARAHPKNTKLSRSTKSTTGREFRLEQRDDTSSTACIIVRSSNFYTGYKIFG